MEGRLHRDGDIRRGSGGRVLSILVALSWRQLDAGLVNFDKSALRLGQDATHHRIRRAAALVSLKRSSLGGDERPLLGRTRDGDLRVQEPAEVQGSQKQQEDDRQNEGELHQTLPRGSTSAM